ncbi:MAG: SDR family NAD(P)-dependent oxidoreductase [Acidimicrobiales bacterium]
MTCDPVIVTGASGGIGLAVVRRLVGQGGPVAALSRTRGDLQPLLERSDATSLRWYCCDVTDVDQVAAAVAAAATALGGLASVVCAAGAGVFGSVEDTPDAVALDQFDVNYHGVVRTIRAALPSLRHSQGRIAVVGSLAGRAPMPYQTHYSAAKAALEALTLALSCELRSAGIRVSLIEPGDIRTRFLDAMPWIPASAAYAAEWERVAAVVRTTFADAPAPDVVARVVTRALAARRPRSRYTVGPSRVLVAAATRALPDRVNLRLIRRHFALSR